MRKVLIALVGLLVCSPTLAALRGSAGQANTSTSSSVTVNVSSIGIQSGDIVIFFMNGGGASGTATLTAPSGFSAVPNCSGISGLGSGTAEAVWYKVAGTSEPSSYTATSSVTDYQTAEVWVFSGRNTSSPFDYEVTSNTGIASTSPASLSYTGFTPSVTGDDLLVVQGNDNSPTAFSAVSISISSPSGFANSLTTFGASTVYSPPVEGIADQDIGTAATGTVTGSETWSGGNTNEYYGGYLIAMKPSGGASCTHSGYTSAGSIAVPNGTSGSYLGKSGGFVTPDCSTVNYWQPTQGNFGVN